MQDFEKLGLFYLGKRYDLEQQQPAEELVLYESKDLVTHGVCVGMTGSGKTGLCLAVLEEAAIDGIPAIVLDPKGDLCNLFLTFPELRGSDFEPWVNEEDAQSAGLSVSDFAEKQAAKWRQGLADWGQDGERIRSLKDSVDLGLYTPGSETATPLSILHSFEAPSPELRADAEALNNRISSIVTGLLGLLGIDADPLQSREHVLISNLLAAAWDKGETLDLGSLIGQIQAPPIERIGVLDLETFYPTKDRVALAMRLNNLLAAPSFRSWMAGETLDIRNLLHTSEGKPRVSIISIAHLSDAERMFFVTLLLSELVSWMRMQSGTTSLRALFYMDEIFGYFPPVANPPSKQPLLTLLKQARAYGLGILLATQNPVDLDYKGLSNTGTWFIGRLQTERDKARVLDGLEGAAATTAVSFDRKQIERILSGLGNRVFLMNNVHDNGPTVFQVRWALSYLRGPLARAQLRRLCEEVNGTPVATDAKENFTATAAIAASAPFLPSRPTVPSDLPEYFLTCEAPPDGMVHYQPAVLGCGRVFFHDRRSGVDQELTVRQLVTLAAEDRTLDWSNGQVASIEDRDLSHQPLPNADYADLPPFASKSRIHATWSKAFTDWLYRSQRIEVFHCKAFKAYSTSGETERDFAARLQQAQREKKDAEIEKLRQQHAKQIATLSEKIRRAAEVVDRENAQATERKAQTAISFGSTILGALFGRKAVSATNLSKAATAARGVGRSMKESQDVQRAQANLDALRKQMAELEAKLAGKIDALLQKLDTGAPEIEVLQLRPKRADVSLDLVALVWLPRAVV